MPLFGPPSSHIRSRDYTTAIRGALLSNAVIDRYILQGRYGDVAKQELIVERKARRRVPKAKVSTVKQALEALGL